MVVKEFKEKIQGLIGVNKIDEAFEEMESYFRNEANERLLNMVAVIKADYTDLKATEIRGTISYDERSRKKNEINVRLLEVCSFTGNTVKAHIEETKAACKASYGLLLYLSENTNAKAVFFEDANKNYFLRKPQGEEFIEKLPDLYLTQGHGMYLPKEVVEDFYIFRAKVYKIIDHAQFNNNDNDLIQVTNPGIKKLVKVLSERLSKNLKKYF